jgi:hypothetical protein
MTVTFHHSIRGYLVGALWWPIGAEAWKSVDYDLTAEDRRFGEPQPIREHVLQVTNDGDFAGGCEVANGELITTATITRGARVYQRTRVTLLERFQSVADLILLDWAGPTSDDD